MYKNKKVLAIILARGGSKGIPKKNIKNLAGKPLIAWTIEEAKKSEYLDRLILSTDDQEIIDVASAHGCEAPFKRPNDLAQDSSVAIDAFVHALQTLEEKYDYALLLQCTSPFRTAEDIDGCIAYCIDKEAESCVSVGKSKSNLQNIIEIDDEGEMKKPYQEELTIKPRQDFEPIYELNGAIFMVSCSRAVETNEFIHKDSLAYLMPEDRSLDIDTEMDFKIADALIRSKQEVTCES